MAPESEVALPPRGCPTVQLWQQERVSARCTGLTVNSAKPALPSTPFSVQNHLGLNFQQRFRTILLHVKKKRIKSSFKRMDKETPSSYFNLRLKESFILGVLLRTHSQALNLLI